MSFRGECSSALASRGPSRPRRRSCSWTNLSRRSIRLIRTHLQDELLVLQRKLKRTIIFVSHDLDEALKIGTRIAIMEAGRIVQYGAPQDIVLQPCERVCGQFRCAHESAERADRRCHDAQGQRHQAERTIYNGRSGAAAHSDAVEDRGAGFSRGSPASRSNVFPADGERSERSGDEFGSDAGFDLDAINHRGAADDRPASVAGRRQAKSSAWSGTRKSIRL